MTKNAKIVWLVAIGLITVVVILIVGRDVWLRPHGTLDCGDGPRRTIDIRDFTTEYSGYSVELEANLGDKAKISTKITPVQVQQLSDAMQNAREFRQYLVAGYDSCAISKSDYLHYEVRFQAFDSLAHEINELVAKPSLSQEDSARIANLIRQYSAVVPQRGTE